MSITSKQMRELWQDPEYRERVTAHSIPRFRTQTGKNWKNLNTREKYLAHLQTFSKSSEQRAANSVRTKALWADPEYRAMMLAARKDSYTTERAKRAAATRSKGPWKPWNKGKTKFTDARLQQVSVTNSLNGQRPWNHRATWYATRKRAVLMNSRWEVTFALFMDFLGVKWEYESCRFYVGDGPWSGKRYIPDFYLPEEDRFIEVKGHFPEHQQRKFAAFRRLHPEAKVSFVQLKDLVRLGLVTLQGRIVRPKAPQ